MSNLYYQVAYDDFVAAGSLAAAREKGLVSLSLYSEYLLFKHDISTYNCMLICTLTLYYFGVYLNFLYPAWPPTCFYSSRKMKNYHGRENPTHTLPEDREGKPPLTQQKKFTMGGCQFG